jgi:hypothetical protein
MKILNLAATVLCASFLSASAAESGSSNEGNVAGRPNTVLGTKDCNEVWRRASPNNSDISPEQAQTFVSDFQLVDDDRNGLISISEFKAACEKGLVRIIAPEPGSRGKSD